MTSWDEFGRLSAPERPADGEPETFTASISEGPWWLARDHRGFPCLMIESGAAGGPSELRLEHLRVQSALACEIKTPVGTTHAALTVLRCTSTAEELQRLFISLVDVIVGAIGEPPVAMKVQQIVQQLAAMFSALSRPPRNTIQGIWGELLLIASARDPARLIRAWHATPADDFDFSECAERIEVKTTSNRVRQHLFTLEQLHPPAGTSARIASIIVRPAGGGASIGSLMDDIEARIADSSVDRLKLHALVIETLGTDWKDAVECRFDREAAVASVAFYNVESVPQLDGGIPVGVSRISFASDLSLATPVVGAPLGSLYDAATRAGTRAFMPARLDGESTRLSRSIDRSNSPHVS